MGWEETVAVLPRIPRILFVVPGMLGGIFIPSVIVTRLSRRRQYCRHGQHGFHEGHRDLRRGQCLTFVDSSHNIHEIGPGNNGQILSPVRGDPLTGFHLMETNSVYTTGPWLTPGTYYVTCGSIRR